MAIRTATSVAPAMCTRIGLRSGLSVSWSGPASCGLTSDCRVVRPWPSNSPNSMTVRK